MEDAQYQRSAPEIALALAAPHVRDVFEVRATPRSTAPPDLGSLRADLACCMPGRARSPAGFPGSGHSAPLCDSVLSKADAISHAMIECSCRYHVCRRGVIDSSPRKDAPPCWHAAAAHSAKRQTRPWRAGAAAAGAGRRPGAGLLRGSGRGCARAAARRGL